MEAGLQPRLVTGGGRVVQAKRSSAMMILPGDFGALHGAKELPYVGAARDCPQSEPPC